MTKVSEGSFVKYDHFMRVSTRRNEENKKYSQLKIFIISL